MKIVTWAIIFVVVIFSFSFGNRVILNNKFEIVKEEVKYNNAVDQATVDATTRLMQQMVNLNEETNETQYMILSSIDKFFETFSLSLGYYGGEVKQSNLKVFVPLVIVMTDDGYYAYTQEEMKKKSTPYTYIEHTLKPEIPYSDTILDGTHKIYINYTIDNHVKIYFNDVMYEGNVLDTRHEEDCLIPKVDRYGTEILADGTEIVFRYDLSADGVFSKVAKYKGKDIKYVKKLIYQSNVRYLCEYWYVDDISDTAIPVEVRQTEYTMNDVAFTNNLNAILGEANISKEVINFLCQGNPENKGMKDPFTGTRTMGEFNRKRRAAISSNVISKAEQYVLKHNKFARMNGISYTFVLPEVEDTDWDNALQDVTIISFVQGMPLASESYYNDYSFSGARIVKRETYQALPIRNIEIDDDTDQNTEEFPVYYSSYGFNDTQINQLEASGSKLFYYAQEAANEGYFPYIGQFKQSVDELEKDVYFLDIELTKTGDAGSRLPGQDRELHYKITAGNNKDIHIRKIAYLNIEDADTPSNEYILTNGTEVFSNELEGTFAVHNNGKYVIAVEEDKNALYQTCSDRVVVTEFDKPEFENEESVTIVESTDSSVEWNKARITVTLNNNTSAGISRIDWKKSGEATYNTINNPLTKTYSFKVDENGTYDFIVYSAAYGTNGDTTQRYRNIKTALPVNGVEEKFSIELSKEENTTKSAQITTTGTHIASPINPIDIFSSISSTGGTPYGTSSVNNPYSKSVYLNGTYTIRAYNASRRQSDTKTIMIDNIEDFEIIPSQLNIDETSSNLTVNSVVDNFSLIQIVAVTDDGTSNTNIPISTNTYTYSAVKNGTYTFTVYNACGYQNRTTTFTVDNIVIPEPETI